MSRTYDEIKKYAYGFAEGFFYADDDIPWEPFEDWDDEDIREQVNIMAASVVKAMIWILEGEQT